MAFFEYTSKYSTPVIYENVTGFNYTLVQKYHNSVGLNFETSYFKQLLDSHCNFTLSDCKYGATQLTEINEHRVNLGLSTMTLGEMQQNELNAKQGGWVRNEVCADIVSRPRPIIGLNQQHGDYSPHLNFMANCDFGVMNKDETLSGTGAADEHAYWRNAIVNSTSTSISQKDPIFGDSMNGFIYLPYTKGDGVHGATTNAWYAINAISNGWSFNNGSYVLYGSYPSSVRRVFNWKNEKTTNAMSTYYANCLMSADLPGVWFDTSNPLQGYTNGGFPFDQPGVQTAFEAGHYQNWMYKKARDKMANHSATYNGAKNPLLSGNAVRQIIVSSTLGFGTFPNPYLDTDIMMSECISNDNTKSYWKGNYPATWKYITDLCYGDSTGSNKWHFIQNHANGASPYLNSLCCDLICDAATAPSDGGTDYFQSNNVIGRIGRIGYPVEAPVTVSGDSTNGVYVRRFTHGVVICNNSNSTYTFTLPVAATQSFPAIGTIPSNWTGIYKVGMATNYNTGATLPNSVVIPAHSGIIASLKSDYYDVNPYIPPTPTQGLKRPTDFKATLNGTNVALTWVNNTSDITSAYIRWNKTGCFLNTNLHDSSQWNTTILTNPNANQISITIPNTSNDVYYFQLVQTKDSSTIKSWITAVDKNDVSYPTGVLTASNLVMYATQYGTRNNYWARSKPVHWEWEAEDSYIKTAVIQLPLSWNTGGVSYGFQLQFKPSNIPSTHPAAKWNDIWWDMKDRWTHDSIEPDEYNTFERRQGGGMYEVHMTEHWNTGYDKPYEIVYRNTSEIGSTNYSSYLPIAKSECPTTEPLFPDNLFLSNKNPENIPYTTGSATSTKIHLSETNINNSVNLANDSSYFVGGSKMDEPPCTVQYRVRSFNSSGIPGPWSNVLTTTFNPKNIYNAFNSPITASDVDGSEGWYFEQSNFPLCPEGLTASSREDNGDVIIDLTWVNPVPTSQSAQCKMIRVYMKPDNIDESNSDLVWTKLDSLASTAVSYSHNLGPNPIKKGYSFTIEACNFIENESDDKTRLSYWNRSYPYRIELDYEGSGSQPETVPDAPTDLAVDQWVRYDNYELHISWVDNADDELGYRVYISTDSQETWSLVQSLGENSESCKIDCGVSPDFGTWYVKVIAYNGIGDSNALIIDYTTSSLDTSAPLAPTDLQASTLVDDGHIYVNLQWVNVATNSTSIEILQSSNDIDFTTIASGIDPDTQSHQVDLGIEPTGTYYFKVAATNDYGETATDSVMISVSSIDVNPSIITTTIAVTIDGINSTQQISDPPVMSNLILYLQAARAKG